ncbi:phosphoribosylglycinamide formyltransferase [Truepera radiovictrix]|uniref:Phosphoribosylglycinamide formyltransferase n=1 Tax=Truepera radiovictrix (strain DSM 17093 / CIP 108686 / LMG 22925 / RQ-24) TaxID=649638 RepID=D7CUB9_TRURR|nr:phosphoribosylglycinamide formyltransferase [Truepera radiovictrix]ADI15704.1 phosphoribosylglycinamide formyltransferase [Truepera radiovictrix DSM 17093]WMT58669.1 phosphoribosylglycinamide formyltransferase [Truepera radiovictrix]
MVFPLGRPARLAVLASGRGSNLRALAAAFPPGDPLGSVVLVLSNRRDAPVLALARDLGIEARFIPFGADRARFEREATAQLTAAGIDLVLLAGFMRVLSPAFTARYAGRLVNIHPSLLPRFPGLHAQRQALEAGARESGCTVHFVDAGVDTGPVILQRRVPVLPDDTEERLAARILAQEHRAYPEAVRRVLLGEARFEAPQNQEATP